MSTKKTIRFSGLPGKAALLLAVCASLLLTRVYGGPRFPHTSHRSEKPAQTSVQKTQNEPEEQPQEDADIQTTEEPKTTESREPEDEKDPAPAAPQPSAPAAQAAKSQPPAPSAHHETPAGIGASQAPEHIITHCGTPTKLPKKAPNGIDALDLRYVTMAKGVSIADWEITSNISGVSFGSAEVCTPHSKSGQWPKLDFFGDKETKVEGNMWIFAFINGHWVGGAGHWLRPGQTCKGTNLNEVGPDLYYDAPPLRNWSPCHGELVGFAVSAPARAGQWGTAERSNVIMVHWP